MAHIFGHQSCSLIEIVHWFVRTNTHTRKHVLFGCRPYIVMLHATFKHTSTFACSMLLDLNCPSFARCQRYWLPCFSSISMFCAPVAPAAAAYCCLLFDATCCCLLCKLSLGWQVFAQTRILRIYYYFFFSISSFWLYKYLFCLWLWHVLLSFY